MARKKAVENYSETGIKVVDGGSLLPTASPPENLAKEIADAKDIVRMVEEFQIVEQSDMDFANECLAEVKAKARYFEAEKKKATQPMNEALGVVRGWFRPVETFYNRAEAVWKEKIGAWHLAQAERQRLALAAVQEAHQAGDVQGVAQAMAVASQATVETPSNVTVREVWEFEVVEPEAVPREYCSPDESKIRQAVSAFGDSINIPGVKVKKGTQVVQRKIA